MRVSICREEMLILLREMHEDLSVGNRVDLEPVEEAIKFILSDIEDGKGNSPISVMGVMRSLYVRAIKKRDEK